MSQTSAVEVMDFSEDRKTVQVKLPSGDYVLKEALSSDVYSWKNFIASQMKMEGTSVVSLGRTAEAEAVLLGRCLFPVGKEQPCGDAFVKLLSSKTTEALIKKLKEISHITEDESVEAIDKRIEELTEKKAKLAGAKEERKNE